jgi:hypothetical protein
VLQISAGLSRDALIGTFGAICIYRYSPETAVCAARGLTVEGHLIEYGQGRGTDA